jgi:arylsulfatase
VRTFRQDGRALHNNLWWLHEGNRALRAGDWKLVAAKDEPWELFNLAKDRTETRNLAAEHPEILARLENQWEGTLRTFVELASKRQPGKAR